MGRSVWKGPYVASHLLKKAQAFKLEAEEKKHDEIKPIKTWSRSTTICPQFMDLVFLVHNGRKFIPVRVKESMVGHKLGEFAPTRTFSKHSGDKKANIRKKVS